MNYGQKKIRDLIEQTAIEMRDPADNYVYQSEVAKEVECRLRDAEQHPAVMAEIVHLVAQAETRAFFNSRKPKFSAQGSLYMPFFWLPLGKGKRVQMSDASDFDLTEYGDGVRVNRERVDLAEDKTRLYVAQRVAELKGNPGRRLHWVEINLFGFDEKALDPEEYLCEEDD